METIHTSALTLSYGDQIIIDEMDLKIPKGKITVFIGGNGCGKSTLLRSIARLLKPRDGSVLLAGEDIAKLPTKTVAKKLAILPVMANKTTLVEKDVAGERVSLRFYMTDLIEKEWIDIWELGNG